MSEWGCTMFPYRQNTCQRRKSLSWTHRQSPPSSGGPVAWEGKKKEILRHNHCATLTDAPSAHHSLPPPPRTGWFYFQNFIQYLTLSVLIVLPGSFHVFSAHFPSIFCLWYPNYPILFIFICRFSAHMFTDSAYFPRFSAYFPPSLAPIFRRSCLAGLLITPIKLTP